MPILLKHLLFTPKAGSGEGKPNRTNSFQFAAACPLTSYWPKQVTWGGTRCPPCSWVRECMFLSNDLTLFVLLVRIPPSDLVIVWPFLGQKPFPNTDRSGHPNYRCMVSFFTHKLWCVVSSYKLSSSSECNTFIPPHLNGKPLFLLRSPHSWGGNALSRPLTRCDHLRVR